MIDRIKSIIDKALALYDKALAWILNIGFLRTYYDTPQDAVRHIADKGFLKLTPDELAASLATCPLRVVGREKVDRAASRLIWRHGFYAALVTTICTVPQNWFMWVLFVVDIVFFQKEVFVATQQLSALYGVRREEEAAFDYTHLAATAVKMEGVLLKQKMFNYLKKAFGFVVRKGIVYVGRVMRGSLRILVRQGVKWAGVILGMEWVDGAIDWFIILITSVIAGLISYWLFVPMCRRLQRKLVAELNAEQNTGQGSGQNAGPDACLGAESVAR